MYKFSDDVDFLRFISISIVVFLHFFYIFGHPPFMEMPVGKALPVLNYGVRLFFVISGYLICSNVIKASNFFQSIDVYRFYVNRISRIIPLLVCVCIILVILDKIGVHFFNVSESVNVYTAIFYAITFRYDDFNFYVNGENFFAWALFWSLSVEEKFYLVFPVIVFLLRDKKYIIPVLVSVLIYSVYYRMHNTSYLFVSSCDSLSIGCLTAIFRASHERLFLANGTRLRLAGYGLMACSLVFLRPNEFPLIGPLAVSLSCALVLSGARYTENRSTSMVYRIGQLSYEIYLFHVIIMLLARNVVEEFLGRSGLNSYSLLFMPFYLAIVFAVSSLVSRYFSEPLNLKLRAVLNAPRVSGGVKSVAGTAALCALVLAIVIVSEYVSNGKHWAQYRSLNFNTSVTYYNGDYGHEISDGRYMWWVKNKSSIIYSSDDIRRINVIYILDSIVDQKVMVAYFGEYGERKEEIQVQKGAAARILSNRHQRSIGKIRELSIESTGVPQPLGADDPRLVTLRMSVAK